MKGIPIIYTEEMADFLKDNVRDCHYKDLARMFNEKFGTALNAKNISQKCLRMGVRNGIDGRIKKGNIPFNKGRKQAEFMSRDSIERSSKTRFPKGNIPHNHRECGSERFTKGGYAEIKVAEPNTWQLKHRYIWEQNFGKLKKNETVEFVDGNRENVSLDNLIVVHRKQSAIMTKLKIRHNDKKAMETAKNVADVVLAVAKRRGKDER